MSLKTNDKILVRLVCMLSFFIGIHQAIATSAENNTQTTTGELIRDVAARNLVILQYHHVSTQTPNSTSVSPSVFNEHMAYLQANHTVVDLGKAIQAIQNNEALPSNAVAITFDDGYTNILENAHPILQKYDFPYTIFINPAIIGESSSQLTWDEIKSMQPLATFANHTLDHAHLLEKYGNENQQQWLTRVMQDINQAEAIIREQLGYSKKWLAYPFGEFNQSLKAELVAQGYIGFGQQSGAISAHSDFGALPRFPAAGVYANLDSLQVKIDSLAMPIDAVKPSRVEFKPEEAINELILTITDKDVRLDAFACYFQGDKLKFIGNENTVTVKVNHTTQAGRARINCTAPSKAYPSRYYWYSHPMFTSTHEGEFLD